MTAIRLAALSAATILALGGAALAADISPVVAYPPAPSPVYAPQPIAMGYAELSFGWVNVDTDDIYLRFDDDDADSFNAISGAGYANIPFPNWWNFELEARGSSVYQPGDFTLASQVGGYGHIYWRDPSKWAAGVFGGYSNFSLFNSAANLWTLGAEALYFWNALTLYGQGGYIWLDTDSDDAAAVFVRAVARYFIQQNLRLQGDVQWTSLVDGGLDADILTLVGTVEYRLSQVPLSGFASVRWDSMSGDFDVDATTFLIGIRGYLGSGSLLDNDRNGAPLDVLPFPAVVGFEERGGG